jgi:hypothetical protein
MHVQYNKYGMFPISIGNEPWKALVCNSRTSEIVNFPISVVGNGNGMATNPRSHSPVVSVFCLFPRRFILIFMFIFMFMFIFIFMFIFR